MNFKLSTLVPTLFVGAATLVSYQNCERHIDRVSSQTTDSIPAASPGNSPTIQKTPTPAGSSSPLGSPSPSTSPTPSGAAAYRFTDPSEFTSTATLRMRKNVFKIPKSEVFKRIVMKAQIFHGGWNTTTVYTTDGKPYLLHYHTLYWLGRGGKWQSHLVYAPEAKEGPHKLKLSTNVDKVPVDNYTVGSEKSYLGFLNPYQWYDTLVVYDAPSHKVSLTITNSQGTAWTVVSTNASPYDTIGNPYDTYMFFFGFGPGSPDNGPDASTEGWKIRNLEIEFYH